MAKAVGALARDLRVEGRFAQRRREAFDVQGLLVNERFTKRFMSPEDLDEYTLVRAKDGCLCFTQGDSYVFVFFHILR